MGTDWPALLKSLGDSQALFVNVEGQPQPHVAWQAESAGALLPGSFNPVHAGHWGLAQAGGEATGLATSFELSLTNVDKPPLEADEVVRRLAAFRSRAGVWLTRAPRFVQKARLFPRATFIVGADTLQRILDPAYYGNEAALAEGLQFIKVQQCRFLVAGRVNAAGRFLHLHDLTFPLACAELFTALPEDVFRFDLSSTQLRGNN